MGWGYPVGWRGWRGLGRIGERLRSYDSATTALRLRLNGLGLRCFISRVGGRLLLVDPPARLPGPVTDQGEEGADEEHVDDHEACDDQPHLEHPAGLIGPRLAQHAAQQRRQ